MENLGNMNESYYFEDTRILFKVFESRASIMKKKKMVLTWEGVIQAALLADALKEIFSKIKLALPIDDEIAEFFEKTLISVFSCVNSCLTFNIEISFSNKKFSDELQSNKREDLETDHNLRLKDN